MVTLREPKKETVQTVVPKEDSKAEKVRGFFKEREGEGVFIRHVLNHFSQDKPHPMRFSITDNGKELIIDFPSGHRSFFVYTEPRTSKRSVYGYFYPEELSADEKINPRPLILNRVLKSLNAFMEGETRFQSCIGRIIEHPDGKYSISIFDGSHGAAAELFSGSGTVLSKFYLPGHLSDSEALHWNNHAHSELRQQEFRGQVLAQKRSQALEDRMHEFLTNKDKDMFPKSEKVFVEKFIKPLEKKGMQAAIVEDVINYVLYSEQEVETADGRTKEMPLCRLVEFVKLEAQARRGGKQISYNLLRSTIFKEFIHPGLCDFDKLDGKIDDDPRHREKNNLLRLCNLLALHTLERRWGITEDGTKKGKPTKEAIISERLWKKGAVRYWAVELRKAIALKMRLTAEDAGRVFQVNIPPELWQAIEESIEKLYAFGAWENEKVADLLNANTLDTTIGAIRDWAEMNDNKPVLDAYYLADMKRPL